MSKRFSDFAVQEDVMDGNKIKMSEIIGKEISVTGFKIANSKVKPNEKCLTIQFILDGENRVVFTGSVVLTDQCMKYESEMPFDTVIKSVNKYYTFS
jgi:hypothetical protein